jgi:hypothetical protein
MKTFLAVAAIVLSTVAVADAQMDNPEYKSWSGFKAGAWVKFKMVSEASGVKTEIEQTVKLVELTNAKAVVETGMVMAGNKIPAQKREIPAKITIEATKDAKAPKDVKVSKPAEGDQEIDVGGKKVKAHWVESTTETGGYKTLAKIWQAKGVPGGTVKMEATTTGAVTSKTLMVATEWKE